MPIRDTPPPGSPCWVDLLSSDAERSRSFYGDLLGWEVEEPVEEYGGYASFTRDGVPVAGLMPRQPGMEGPDGWSVHLAVEDAPKTLEVAARAGARIVAPAMPVGDLGTLGVLVDPVGATVGVWQPGRHPGFRVVAEPGAPSWFELHARGYARAVAFYREVFGWETHVVADAPQFRYTVQVHDEEWLAGIADADAFLPAGVPSHWAVYFGVEDTDAAVARCVELGGAVVDPAEDTEYGRIATVTDSAGVRLKLVAANAAMPERPLAG